MFLGYQKGKIVLTANTREELENTPCMSFDSIEESSVEYTLYNGEYLTPEEVAVKEKETHKKELIAELDALDLRCIRALRAIQSGAGTELDSAQLAELEKEAEDIRKQIKELGV